jgi:opacity protein-like surface antigen
MKRSAILLSAIFFLFSAGSALAQQADISLSAIGAFTDHVSGDGVHEWATTSGGGLLSFRHFSQQTGPGLEVNYGYTKNSQIYVDSSYTKTSVQASIHEFSGAYVYRFKTAFVQPFLRAGGGLLIFSPTSSASDNAEPTISRKWQPAFMFGGGADLPLSRHLGLRAQYRGFVYKAPDFFGQQYMRHTGSAMVMSEPAMGVVLHF